MRLGVVIAALAIVVALATLALPFPAIDRDAILRFIAPTAFEIRSIEEILEGGGP
ncbi:hypothetical protein [Paracoccus fistulariae]|uniref:Uncharacterized protein n=1 Tax=Paracoccus fistulariae TaxID=658446 RepID=A0ABY7SPK4_9RHOB|nr:hypothetical protein [Paracoccus fistulariae]MDB6183028.1 hypothetical protein [Paracoccus fistulariae]WCR08823.1 hypothetical protein JHX87_08555 [Paracoccus fistulariae]